MQHTFYAIELALLLCAAVALPISTYVAYRRTRGRRGAVMGNCLWAIGDVLLIAVPASFVVDHLGRIPPDAAIRDVASSVGPGVLPLGLLLVMLGLVFRPSAKKETAR